MNNVILVGRLTENPEILEIENDKKVTTVILAVNRNFKNTDGLYEVDFIINGILDLMKPLVNHLLGKK